MQLDFLFLFNSILLGTGLAMDAFSVSLVNGLNEPKMSRVRLCEIAGVFAFFQAFMPMTGWFLVKSVADKFTAFQKFIPWIALLLLLYIGINMLREGIKNDGVEKNVAAVSVTELIIQGIATSIDALSVGFTISSYNAVMAFLCSLIIAAVTFLICAAGIIIGRHCGTKFSGKSSMLGGMILIFIGIEIFIKGI
ncbi:MAG: manganese efflux pump [Clostridia bacterium]|nr:manganese efflux pump [Clostridia bacterium]MBR2883876.1 manganese efflux pump [Clostridia bacterium]